MPINWSLKSPPWLTQIATPGGGVIWGVNAEQKNEDNVYFYRDGVWSVFENVRLQSVSAGPDGVVIGLGVPSSAGVPLYRLTDGKWVCTLPNLYTSLTVGADGSQWATDTNIDPEAQALPNIFRMPPGASAFAPLGNGWLTSIAVAPDGTPWGVHLQTALGQSNLYRFVNNQWKVQLSPYFTSIAIDSHGSVWGINANLPSHEPNVWCLSGAFTQPYVARLSSISCDPEGNVWGTDSAVPKGQSNLCQLVNGAFKLTVPRIDRLAVTPDGGLWALDTSLPTSATNIYRFQDGVWWNVPAGYLTDIAVTANGVWGINSNETVPANLYQWSEGNWVVVTALPSPMTALAIGPDGSIWCVNGKLLGGPNTHRYYNGNWILNVGDGHLTDVAVSADGSTWGISDTPNLNGSNLYKLDGDSWNLYGQGSNQQFSTITAGAESDIWAICAELPVGTSNLFRFAAGEQEAAFEAELIDVAVNTDGAIWGIDRNGRVFMGIQFPENMALALLGNQYVQVQTTPFALDTQPLTIEAWVNTATGGPIFSAMKENQVCILLAIGDDGSLLFTLGGPTLPFDGSPFVSAAMRTSRTAILDGEWHHVAGTRELDQSAPVPKDVLRIYFDGVEQTPATRTTGPALQIDLSLMDWASIGGWSSSVAPGIPSGLTGCLDEVRIWKRALTCPEINYGMHHRIASVDKGLIGWWTFDEQNTMDYSPGGTIGTPVGSPGFIESEIDFARRGEPYLVTQAVLLQDYISNGGAFTATDGYRVLITAKTSLGTPRPAEIAIWADEPLDVHFSDGTSESISSLEAITRRTTSAGELSFVIPAAQGQAGSLLLCPVIKIRADFMDLDERIVIYPDRHVHSTMATITGNGLLGLNAAGEPLRCRKSALPAAATPPQAAALAAALNHIMSTAVEHSVQPERPLTRSRDLPEDRPEPRPYVPRYQNQRGFAGAYNPATNEIATHFVDRDTDLVRILVPEQMPNAQWSYNVSTGSFTPHATPEDAHATLQQLIQNTPVGHNDPLANVFAGQTSVTISPDALLSAERRQLASRSGGSLWDIVEDVVAVVVNTVVATVEDETERIVQTVLATVVHLVDGVVQAFDVALQTVEDAVQFVHQLFTSLGADIQAFVDLVKSLFEWEDIVASQKAIRMGLQKALQGLIGQMSILKNTFDADIQTFQSEVDSLFDAAIAKVGGHTVAATSQAKGGARQDIRSNYVTHMTGNSLTAQNSAAGFNFADTLQNQVTAIAQSLSTAVSGDLDKVWTDIQASGVLDGLSDSSTTLEGALALLLKGLKVLFDATTDFFQQIIDIIFEGLAAVLQSMDALLNERIELPLITDFYENVVMAGEQDEQMTGYGLIALLGAVPFTVAYKLIAGNDTPPFTQADLDGLAGASWQNLPQYQGAQGTSASAALRDSSSDRVVDLVYLSFTFVNAVATAVWGVTSAIFDEPADEALELVGSTKTTLRAVHMSAQLVSIVCSYPSGSGRTFGCAFIAWAPCFAPFISNLIVSFQSDPAEIESWDRTDVFVCGSYGIWEAVFEVVQLGAALSEDQPLVDTLLNLVSGETSAMEWWPQWFKLTTDAPTVPAWDVVAYGLTSGFLAVEGVLALSSYNRNALGPV